MLYVNNLARAVEWYKSKLDFKENFVSPNAYASLRHEGMNFKLDLHPTEANSKDIGYGCLNYFVPQDFDKAIVDLQNKGVKVGTPKREGDSPRFVTIWDSEGNALGLIEA